MWQVTVPSAEKNKKLKTLKTLRTASIISLQHDTPEWPGQKRACVDNGRKWKERGASQKRGGPSQAAFLHRGWAREPGREAETNDGRHQINRHIWHWKREGGEGKPKWETAQVGGQQDGEGADGYLWRLGKDRQDRKSEGEGRRNGGPPIIFGPSPLLSRLSRVATLVFCSTLHVPTGACFDGRHAQAAIYSTCKVRRV